MNVSQAIEAAAAVFGSQEKLAKHFGLQKAAVSHWKRIDHVPSEFCPTIEYACEGAVASEDLCPVEKWVRVKDKNWPHKDGRPCVEHPVKTASVPEEA